MRKTKRYIKKFFTLKTFLIFISSIIIASSIVLIKENRFTNTYKNVKYIEATGIIKSQITEKEYGNSFNIEIIECVGNKKIEKTGLKVTDTEKNNLKYGDIIKITGEYKNIESYKNQGVFNYKESLKKDNIYGKLDVDKIEKIGENTSIYKYFVYANEKIQQKYEENFSNQTSNILKGLIIGINSDIDSKIKEKIQENGLSHILAISGTHISCIILILNKILEKISYDNRKKKKLILTILIIYNLVIGFIASAMRAIIMTILTITAKLIFKKNKFEIDLSIASLIILIINPYYLIDSGFLLSFGATIGIIYILPILNKIKIKNKIINYFFQMLLVSIAVNIFIFPTTIYLFKRMSITSIVIGLIISPLAFIMQICGIITIFLPTNIIKLIKPIIEILVNAFIYLSQIDLGWSYFKVLNILEITIYYIFLIYIINHKKRFSKIIKNILIILTIINTIVYFQIRLKNELTIHFIDVGQGDSTLIETPENKTILIDGGGNENYNIGKNVLIPYLLNKKINKIDYMLISHFDTDHVGGCIEVAKYLKVKNIIISKQTKETENFQELIQIAKEKNIKIIICKKGDEINISKSIKLKILWPKEELISTDINDNSIVAKLEYNNTSILFTGDITQNIEKEILKNQNIKSDILKIAHHGSKTSSNIEFIKKVNPKISLIGVGENNTFGHPSNITIENLKNIRSKIYRTDINGEITINVNKNGIEEVKHR